MMFNMLGLYTFQALSLSLSQMGLSLLSLKVFVPDSLVLLVSSVLVFCLCLVKFFGLLCPLTIVSKKGEICDLNVIPHGE